MENDTENVWWIDREGLQQLLDHLADQGYEIVGPRIDQGAIVYDTIQRVDDLPRGWTDDSQPGVYRLKPRSDNEHFGYNVGPHSWKKYLFPPLTEVMRSRRTADGWTMESPPAENRRYAFLGVRACELAAIAVQDKVFLGSEYRDPVYQLRRSQLFIIAVNCTQAASTCFCTSMGTGPECTSGFDLAFTEIEGGFLMVIGSEAGRTAADTIDKRPASAEESLGGSQRRQRATDQIVRHLETDGIRDRLLSKLDHPHWDDVASRCLSCANCTLVCPTCFCHSVDEVHDLVDDEIVRNRRWDSCFNVDFSHVAGGSVRDTTRARYRQWLTHKLATWIDQFGTSGCVGCGRCIAWCPVGIDLTQEVATLCGGNAP
jgi:formate hydrogenlyase subunit 6/NADH:ubiquinone oxidoreductase subunit I